MKILQIGHQTWENEVSIPNDMDWFFTPIDGLATYLEELLAEENRLARLKDPEAKEITVLHFSAVLITAALQEEELAPLEASVAPYTLFYDMGISLEYASNQGIFRKKLLRELPITGTRQDKVNFLYLTLFDGQFGSKVTISDIDVNPSFQGTVNYMGNVRAEFEGDFGEDLTALFSFRTNLMPQKVALELWLEYVKQSEDVQLELEVTALSDNGFDSFINSALLDETYLKNPIILHPEDGVSSYSVAVYAKGQGKLEIGSLHWRQSRIGLGTLLPGGERHSDDKRQEFFSYFNPGDMTPPLTVFFADYHKIESFQGYELMASLGKPFLLLSDPRVEGGSYYIGTPTYERKIKEAIDASLNYLGFSVTDLILSGLGMGSYAALYYASDFSPHAVVAGEPVVNIGEVVKGLRHSHPDQFETSSDILLNITGGNQEEDIEAINQKFWTKFTNASYGHTSFAIAHMNDDDYDQKATKRLVDYLSAQQIHIYTKGYGGKSGADRESVVKWLLRQLEFFIDKHAQRQRDILEKEPLRRHCLTNLTWKFLSRSDYLYGIKLDRLEEGVSFTNAYLAPGKKIFSFHSRTNYGQVKHSPELPVLQPGELYSLEMTLESEPANRTYTRIEFFNRQGEQVSFQVLRDGKNSFTYPVDAFSYTISLVSAGCESLIFNQLSLYQEAYRDNVLITTVPDAYYRQEDIPADIAFVRPLIEDNRQLR